ncbi:hypothetical protein Ct61P_04878 [Colletotrichum tofieldiae]|nr:hypothetical protein Ct61P_04878 [Colletotrichum tofieldiae]
MGGQSQDGFIINKGGVLRGVIELNSLGIVAILFVIVVVLEGHVERVLLEREIQRLWQSTEAIGHYRRLMMGLIVLNGLVMFGLRVVLGRIDLRRIDLMRINLMRIDLMRTDLMRIDLRRIGLMRGNLMRIDLMRIGLMVVLVSRLVFGLVFGLGRLTNLKFLIGSKLAGLTGHTRLTNLANLARKSRNRHWRRLLRLFLGPSTAWARTTSNRVFGGINLPKVVRADPVGLSLVLGAAKTLEVLPVVC